MKITIVFQLQTVSEINAILVPSTIKGCSHLHQKSMILEEMQVIKMSGNAPALSSHVAMVTDFY